MRPMFPHRAMTRCTPPHLLRMAPMVSIMVITKALKAIISRHGWTRRTVIALPLISNIQTANESPLLPTAFLSLVERDPLCEAPITVREPRITKKSTRVKMLLQYKFVVWLTISPGYYVHDKSFFVEGKVKVHVLLPLPETDRC
jgi:hypothetical protein